MTQNQMSDEELARKRAAVILEVRSGRITATQGAERLGVSRKTYYEWEQKALAAMIQGLENGQSGRPARETDPENQMLMKRIAKLEADLVLARQTVEVRRLLDAYHEKQEKDALRSKKNRKKKKKR